MLYAATGAGACRSDCLNSHRGSWIPRKGGEGGDRAANFPGKPPTYDFVQIAEKPHQIENIFVRLYLLEFDY